MKWQRLSNAPVAALLKSPLHGLISGSVLLITVKGAKSHKRYSTPVNYVHDPDGDDLLVVSLRGRSWWRNLRGGAPVEIVLKGNRITADGELMENDQEVEEALLTVLRQSLPYRKHAGISLDDLGNPIDRHAFEQFARTKVVVRLSTSGARRARPDARTTEIGAATDVDLETPVR